MTPPIPILLYHSVDHRGDSRSTAPEIFERQLSWLADHGYRSLTLEEFDRALSAPSKPTPRKVFLLTFDDGYPDLATVVAPALRRYRFTGVSFLITGACPPAAAAAGNAASLAGSYISWEQARALVSQGVVEFQSHSHSHHRWDAKRGVDDEVATDLANSVDMLAAQLRLPRKYFRHLAWPWGRCNEAWELIGKDLGLTYQHIVQRGAVTRIGQTTRLPRICCDGMTVPTLVTWMTLLSTPGGARFCNTVFGTIRRHRHGLGYV
jgi:peptidoglycan/xylan/chitin deacetylase (PgdA/CDA1 family)